MQPLFAQLLVADTARSVGFYDALGFVIVHQDPVFTRLRWPSGAELYLVQTPAGRSVDGARGVGVVLCFPVEGAAITVEAVAERARAAQARTEGPMDMPWHTREVRLVDPDGYRLTFLQSAWEEDAA